MRLKTLPCKAHDRQQANFTWKKDRHIDGNVNFSHPVESSRRRITLSEGIRLDFSIRWLFAVGPRLALGGRTVTSNKVLRVTSGRPRVPILDATARRA